MKRALLIWAVVLTAGAACAQKPATPYDVVILGGTVVDGTGSVRFRADVAIRGDRIVRVDRDGLVAASAREVVRADGLIVAPGFVHQHAHIQTSIHAHPLAENSTRHIHHVIVNGVPIIRSGALTGATPGRVLQGPARAASRQSQETPRMTATSPELEQRDQRPRQTISAFSRKRPTSSKTSRCGTEPMTASAKTTKRQGRGVCSALYKGPASTCWGEYDHRRVALQEVRFAVEDATRGKDFEHRLRDFNNLPTTRLADIKAVLQVATERVKSRLKVQ